MRKIFLLFLISGVLILAGAGCAAPSKSKMEKETGGLILFVGDGCPHCAKVEEYLEQNKVKEKMKMEIKEVYKNKNNAELMAEKAQGCGFSLDNLGVPFLWNGSKCLVGDQPIINFFQEKIK